MWYTLKTGSGKTVIVQAENSGKAIIKALEVLKRQSKMYETKIDIIEVRKKMMSA